MPVEVIRGLDFEDHLAQTGQSPTFVPENGVELGANEPRPILITAQDLQKKY